MKIKESSRKFGMAVGATFGCLAIGLFGLSFISKGITRFCLGEISLLNFPDDSLVSYVLFGVVDIAVGIFFWTVVRPVVAVIWRANGHVAIIPYDGKNVTLFGKEK